MSIGNTSLHQRGEIPEIVKLPNGRIRVTRRFHKFTREDIDNANLGSLMGDFGDLDTTGEQISNQGYTNCRLISVEVDTGFNSVSNTDSAVLVKTYETLTDLFVQITDDTVTFTENGLKQITRVYRAVSGTTSSNVVAVTALGTGEILASSRIEDNDAFAELTETYIESGVLSISESHRYGDSVEVYSVEGIKLTEAQARSAITDLPATAKFYGSRLSNYEGLQTTIYEFFTGSGVISTSISYSYNDKLTRTTIVSIDETPDTPVGSVLIDSKAETRDEFILYTYTFVEGEGVVSTNSSSKYNGALTVVTVTSINEVPVIPVGSTTIEAQVREEDGYLLYTTTYASGAGVVGVSTDTKYDGKLILTTTTSLNQPPTGITNLIRSESSQSDYGTIYTYTTAVGTGEIGRSTDSKYDDTLTLTTVTSLNAVPDEDGALVRSDVSDTDYGQIYTYTYASGSGVIGTSTDSKYDGALTLTTVTSLNAVPSGTGALIRSDSSNTDYGTIYTYTFADGTGEIGSSTESKYDGKLTLTTKTSLNQVPTGDGALIRSDSSDTDYGTIYTYTFADGSGEIGRSTDSKYDDALTLTTVTSINEVPSEDGALIRSDLSNTDYGAIYTYTFADGEGEIGRSTDSKYDGALTLTTVTSLNAVPSEDGALIRSDSSDTDYGQIYTYTYAEGSGVIGTSTDRKYDNTLTLTTITSLNQTPSGTGALIRSDVSDTDYGTIYTYTYASGAGIIGTSTDNKYNNTLTLTTVTTLNQTPTGTGALVRSDVSDTDYGTIYTYTFASGSGEIGRTVDNKYNDTLTLTTVTSINAVPDEDGALIRSDSNDTDYGTIYTYTFADGSGEIGRSTDSKYGGTLTLTTITTLNQTPSGTGTLIRSDVSDTDYGQIYTYTYAEGSGEIGRSTDSKYGGTLTLTTITSLNQAPSGSGALIRSDVSDTDYGAIYTYTYAEGTGEIGRSIDSKYDGTLTLTTVTNLNQAPSESGTLIRSDVSDTDYGAIYTYTYAEGTGEIGTSTETKYDGALSVVTKTSLNQVPTGDGALIRSDSSDTDYGTIYTYTFADGEGEIGRSTETKYNGKLTLTTVTSLSEVPSEDGALIRSDSNNTDYGTIYTYTFADGEGEIGSREDSKYDGKLTLTTKISLNEVPSETGAVIRSDSSNTDYGTIYTYTFADGDGEIGRSTETKYDGKLTLTTVTSLNSVPSEDGAVIRSDSNDTDYGTIYTYTYASGEGEIGSREDSKYDNKLTLTTKTSLNTVPTGSGALIRSDVSNTDYGTIYTYTFADGSGEIGRTVDNKYDNTLTLTTVTSLNQVPSEDGALIRSDSNDTDYGTIYTYTYASGSGEIGRTVENKYDGKLILTTVTSLNEVPSEDGYLFRSDSSNNDYGIIFSYVFAEGEGMIAESESERYLGKLKIKSETYLNDPNAAVPAGYTLISQDSRDGDFGVITTITSAEGDGEISNNEETRNDGSVINIFTILGDTPPTAPQGSYLMETSYQAADGYDIYTYYYYKPPTDYQVDVSTTWNKPSTLSWNRDEGFYISDVGSTDSVTGTAHVTFSETKSSAIAIADLSVGAVARENVKYADGTRLVRTTTFTNTYYNDAGASFTSGDYLGEAATIGTVSSSGQNLPSGTVTLGWESVPYFYAGGATIWKTTHTQGVIS